MPATIDQIRSHLDARKVVYYLHPDNEAVLLPYRMSPRFSAKVLVRLEHDGRFLLIRCDDFPQVEASHPLIGEVQQCLLAMNFSKRFVKMSHDPMDGEITMTGELWIEDMELTRAAFDRCMSNFMECLKEVNDALESVLAGRGMPQDEMQFFQPPESEEGEGPAGEEGREAA
jgi:hypothetical protein